MFLKYLIACLFLIPVGCTASNNAVPPGFMQGHLHIVSPKPVELADGNAPAVTAETYTEYPLIIFSQDGKKEIARVTADGEGNYRVAPAAGRLYSGRARPRPQTCPRQAATVHGCLESDRTRRYGY
jgi:hypothetical protein